MHSHVLFRYYKDFNIIEHGFLLHCHEWFGFGVTFTEMIDAFYKEINISFVIDFETQRAIIKC